MRLGLMLAAIAAVLGRAPGLARADRAAVLLVPSDRSADDALAALPARARAAASATREALGRLVPPGPALSRLEAARQIAREKMAAFTQLDEAEGAVAEALAAAMDALPYLADVSLPVALAFDLATVRLALGDRDGAGEALGLSARLDPAVTIDPAQHPPQLQALASEIRPPP